METEIVRVGPDLDLHLHRRSSTAAFRSRVVEGNRKLVRPIEGEGFFGAFAYYGGVGQGEVDYGGGRHLLLLILVGGRRGTVLRRGVGDGGGMQSTEPFVEVCGLHVVSVVFDGFDGLQEEEGIGGIEGRGGGGGESVVELEEVDYFMERVFVYMGVGVCVFVCVSRECGWVWEWGECECVLLVFGQRQGRESVVFMKSKQRRAGCEKRQR